MQYYKNIETEQKFWIYSENEVDTDIRSLKDLKAKLRNTLNSSEIVHRIVDFKQENQEYTAEELAELEFAKKCNPIEITKEEYYSLDYEQLYSNNQH